MWGRPQLLPASEMTLLSLLRVPAIFPFVECKSLSSVVPELIILGTVVLSESLSSVALSPHSPSLELELFTPLLHLFIPFIKKKTLELVLGQVPCWVLGPSPESVVLPSGEYGGGPQPVSACVWLCCVRSLHPAAVRSVRTQTVSCRKDTALTFQHTAGSTFLETVG